MSLGSPPVTSWRSQENSTSQRIYKRKKPPASTSEIRVKNSQSNTTTTSSTRPDQGDITVYHSSSQGVINSDMEDNVVGDQKFNGEPARKKLESGTKQRRTPPQATPSQTTLRGWSDNDSSDDSDPKLTPFIIDFLQAHTHLLKIKNEAKKAVRCMGTMTTDLYDMAFPPVPPCGPFTTPLTYYDATEPQTQTSIYRKYTMSPCMTEFMDVKDILGLLWGFHPLCKKLDPKTVADAFILELKAWIDVCGPVSTITSIHGEKTYSLERAHLTKDFPHLIDRLFKCTSSRIYTKTQETFDKSVEMYEYELQD